jgi:proteasome lid subunit RPN8/RPN11
MDRALEGAQRGDPGLATRPFKERAYPHCGRRLGRMARPEIVVIWVTIGPSAHEAIEAELRKSTELLRQGLETGGWLWARQGEGWWRTEGLVIEFASGPGENPERQIFDDEEAGERISEITYDVSSLEAMDEVFRREGYELVGMYHTHPSGSDQPSEHDLKRVDGLLERRSEWAARTQRALEVILTPGKGESWVPTPWIFMRSKKPKMAGRYQLRPAGVVTLAEPAAMRREA